MALLNQEKTKEFSPRAVLIYKPKR
jgi:hypothetical protein